MNFECCEYWCSENGFENVGVHSNVCRKRLGERDNPKGAVTHPSSKYSESFRPVFLTPILTTLKNTHGQKQAANTHVPRTTAPPTPFVHLCPTSTQMTSAWRTPSTHSNRRSNTNAPPPPRHQPDRLHPVQLAHHRPRPPLQAAAAARRHDRAALHRVWHAVVVLVRAEPVTCTPPLGCRTGHAGWRSSEATSTRTSSAAIARDDAPRTAPATRIRSMTNAWPFLTHVNTTASIGSPPSSSARSPTPFRDCPARHAVRPRPRRVRPHRRPAAPACRSARRGDRDLQQLPGAAPVRAWLASMPERERPRGIVAGQVSLSRRGVRHAPATAVVGFASLTRSTRTSRRWAFFFCAPNRDQKLNLYLRLRLGTDNGTTTKGDHDQR